MVTESFGWIRWQSVSEQSFLPSRQSLVALNPCIGQETFKSVSNAQKHRSLTQLNGFLYSYHLFRIQRRSPWEFIRWFSRIVSHLIEDASIQFCFIVQSLWRNIFVVVGKDAPEGNISIEPTMFSYPSISWPQKELTPLNEKPSLIPYRSIKVGMVHWVIIACKCCVSGLSQIDFFCTW